MPYIDPIGRKLHTQYIPSYEEFFKETDAEAGDLNYCITKICLDWMKYQGTRYYAMNEVLGALEGAKAEFYRRVVVPYEQEKIKVNGDVYNT